MKKRTTAILAMLLCLLFVNVPAEEMPADAFFRCHTGRISYVLPGYPQVIREENLPARELENTYMAWLDKLQLFGTGTLGGEYQVHIADLTPALDWMKEDRPGEDEPQYQLNALMQMVTFYLRIHDGYVTGEPEVRVFRGKEIDGKEAFFPEISFSYAYPDAPDTAYQGRGLMDGSLAVVMMVQADESNLAALADMHILSVQEAEASALSAPETVTVGRLQFTFPEPPLKTEEEGYWLYEAFTPDFGYVSIEHMQADLCFMLNNGMDTDALLLTLAETTAKTYQAQGVFSEYEITKLADGMYAFDALEIDSRYPKGYEPLASHVKAVFTLDGVYTITAVDTEMGREAFATLAVTDTADASLAN